MPSPFPARQGFVSRAAGFLAALSCLLPWACAAPPRARPVPAEASRAMASAAEALRERGPAALARAAEHAARAARLAPDWVAPERLLDQLALDELEGVSVLARRRAELEREPSSAARHYLVGRLEGREGLERHRRALRLEPSLSWAQHALAWHARDAGDRRGALARERRALQLARDPFERVYFAQALAQDLAAAGRPSEASELLEELLRSDGLDAAQRAGLEAQRARLELLHPERARRLGARERTLSLVREARLTDAELSELVRLWRRTAEAEGELVELEAALAARPDPVRDLLRAELLVDLRPSPLALEILERALRALGGDEGPILAEEDSSASLLRAARFAAGRPGAAVERWLSALPAGLRDADGLPRETRLARVVRAARELEAARDDEEAGRELGRALLEAGWFREARAFAEQLAAHDFEAARELERRAVEALAALRELGRVLAPELALPVEPAAKGGARVPRRSLDELLWALAAPLARALAAVGEELEPARLAEELAASPRLSYGPFGRLVQPGPFLGARDEALGFGPRGSEVPGLARAMDRLGRFALVGELAGASGPDATVLRRVGVEERAGRHLGRPWAGVAIFVEGADLEGRAAREGTRLAGAALHEGYWVDVEAAREELALLERLRRRFSSGDPEQVAARLARVLSARGLPVDPGPAGFSPDAPGARARRERAAPSHALGEGRRIRLALLAERAGAGEALGRATLEELLELTALHEQGHLVDRSRFLPLGRDLFGLLAVLVRTGPSPRRIMEELEERAQLVSLCEALEPRLVLAQIVDALEGGPGVHASGYRRLAGELLAELDRALAADPASYPSLDPERTLVHQLHRLGAEEARRAGLALARRRGLVAR